VVDRLMVPGPARQVDSVMADLQMLASSGGREPDRIRVRGAVRRGGPPTTERNCNEIACLPLRGGPLLR
jgi:hypothetical protein